MTPFLWILALTTTLTAAPATQTGATQGSTPKTLTLPEGAPRPAAPVSDLSWLALRNRTDGTVREEKFIYRRVK